MLPARCHFHRNSKNGREGGPWSLQTPTSPFPPTPIPHPSCCLITSLTSQTAEPTHLSPTFYSSLSQPFQTPVSLKLQPVGELMCLVMQGPAPRPVTPPWPMPGCSDAPPYPGILVYPQNGSASLEACKATSRNYEPVPNIHGGCR